MSTQHTTKPPDLKYQWPDDDVVFGFDRVHVWTDRDDVQLPASVLADGSKIECSFRPMKYHALWKSQLRLRQPSVRAIKLVEQALGHEVRQLPNYVEIAMDILCTTRAEARELLRALVSCMRVKSQREVVVEFKGTYYYGRRHQSHRKPGHVLVAYADKRSKLHAAQDRRKHAACLHIEWRATGSKALEQLGIATLSDLLCFDHQRFWDSHITLLSLPKGSGELGRLLSTSRQQQTEISDRALRARAQRWKARHCIGEQFVMHNALLGNPTLAKRLIPTATGVWLRQQIASLKDG